jgi:galactokinase
MNDVHGLKTQIAGGAFDDAVERLYPRRPGGAARDRFLSLLDRFEASFGTGDVRLFSAPGRIEIGGNHTDHQRGVVLAAAIDRDVLCAAAPLGSDAVVIRSGDYPEIFLSLEDLSVQESERGTSSAIVRGVARWFEEHGFRTGGFRTVITSDVAAGSGLSSSAAFEVAVGVIMSSLYNEGKVSGTDIAQAGKYAENVYFGKPSGLMDQAASALGGLLSIDFCDPDRPAVRRVASPLADAGYRICIVDTKGNHTDLTPEYAAIPEEMGCVARSFGKEVLREVDEDAFRSRIRELRASCGDRAVLRALHFFADNRFAAGEAAALDAGDIGVFLALVIRSGRSSLARLQNIYPASDPKNQGLSLALALSEDLLSDGGGAWRVHGGGFAGTILAFVPEHILEQYRRAMDGVFGAGSCQSLSLRSVGGAEVTARLR